MATAVAKIDTRQRMVNAAIELFHKNGIHATSVDGVLVASKTGKSQFSHYFKTKDGLIHAVLQHFYAVRADVFPHYGVQSWEQMEKWFQFFIQFQTETGCSLSCPIGTIGSDLSDEQALLRQDARLLCDYLRGQLARFFATCQAKGELASATDPDSLADFCFTVMEGGMLMVKILRDTAPLKRAAEHAFAYLQSLRVSTAANAK